MKKILKSWLIAVIVGLLSGPQFVVKGYAAASGNYTDLLPIGAAGNTTVISNGTGWSLTTLPPTQTFGDSLSRVVDTVYQSTTVANISASTSVSTFTAISGQGKVGSTTFPATWVATGRTIRITARGRINTTSGTQSMTWGLNIGTTTVMASSTPVVASLSSQPFTVNGIFTINATGNTGTISGGYDIFYTTGAPNIGSVVTSNVICASTQTATAQTVDLTSQVTINPTFTWGLSTQANNIQFNNVLVEFLN